MRKRLISMVLAVSMAVSLLLRPGGGSDLKL